MAAPLRYIVEGGNTLAGSITPSGNKNAALPIIAAALLTDQKVILENVPRILDCETLVELIISLGVTAEWTARNTLAIEAKVVQPSALDPILCAKIRASILLAATFFIGTAMCSAMPAFWENLVACLFMGMSAGGLLPIVYSLLAETIPARRRGEIVVLVAGGEPVIVVGVCAVEPMYGVTV